MNLQKWRWVLSNEIISIQNLHTIVFDFDGVFTDNFVYVDDQGSESVRCSRADSYGVTLLNDYIGSAEIKIDAFVLSTERNPLVVKRCEKMDIVCFSGVKKKAQYLEQWFLTNRPELPNPFSGTLYFGNDLNDLEVMQRVGASFAPADAHPLIKKTATFTLSTNGGQGFVREGIELILVPPPTAQGELREFISNS